jgi:hypothetical protein
MRRRDFASLTGAVLAGELLAGPNGVADDTLVQPARTTRLSEPTPKMQNSTCQSVIHHEGKLLALHKLKPDRRRSYPQYSVAATKPSGSVLWSYDLPGGPFHGLGVRGGNVLCFAAPFRVADGPSQVLWDLDPNTGDAKTIAKVSNGGLFRFVGDSLLFRIASGLGQFWRLGSSLVEELGGLRSRAFSQPFCRVEPISSETVAAVSIDGAYLTFCSASDTSATDLLVSSPFLSELRTFYDTFSQSVLRQHPMELNKAKLAAHAVISAVGGDGSETLYGLAVTPHDPPGVVPVIRFGRDGGASAICTIQRPLQSSGRAELPMKLVVVDSELGVITCRGEVAWYPLPVA